MGNKAISRASDNKIVMERELPEWLDSGKSRMKSLGSCVLPDIISSIVGEYSLCSREKYYVKTILTGVQPISLCLSQDVGSKLASCWSTGFLPSNQNWESSDVKVDKEYLINDYKGCLGFLDQKYSNHCRVVIDVLVVKLSMITRESPSALVDLQNTLKMLQWHLKSVKHVVVSLAEYASCCFSLTGVKHKTAGERAPFDNWQALSEIIHDLDICWNENRMLTPNELFAFYFNGNASRASEVYLANFVVSINHPLGQTLFSVEAPKVLSNKIMWVFQLQALDGKQIERDATRLCRAIRLDISHLNSVALKGLGDRVENPFCYEDNRFIERIIINSYRFGHAMQLPRPSVPLTVATPRSALVELTLEGSKNMLNLADLNNDYFPHLAHLRVVGGKITGRLDSHCVPHLRTLILELGGHSDRPDNIVGPLVREHAQSIIRSDHSWQLVASKEPGGWSLASYDKSTLNSQDEAKDDSPPSHSFINELMLVMFTQRHADELLSRLNGNSSVKADARSHNDGSLVWAPECVRKITTFCTMEIGDVRFQFNKEMLEQPRILSSLTCYNAKAVFDGAALPHLQSLELNGGNVQLSGSFRDLRALSLRDTFVKLQWEVDAPLLQSLHCDQLIHGANLSLNLQSLPRLTSLRMTPNPRHNSFPKILGIENRLGLSHVKEIVFGSNMTSHSCFDDFQVNNVLHLELSVNSLALPRCWNSAVWRCETLRLNFFACLDKSKQPDEKLTLMKVPSPLLNVKTLTVTENGCRVLLDSWMPELIDCTVPSPESLGPN